MTGTSASGVQVANGDPGGLFQAASWHTNLAEGLDTHARMIADTAASVAPSWEGEAAASYQSLSSIVAAHFRVASSRAHTAAATLRHYATELQRCQREGLQAMHQAEHWLAEVHTWTARLATATTAVTTAQGEVTAAQAQLTGAGAMGAKGAGLAAAAAARLRTAQDALTRAQAEQRRAQHELQNAQHQLTHWQHRGEQLWHEAQMAAVQATGELEPLSVPAPPLAGATVSVSSDPFSSLLPQTGWDWAGIGIGGASGYWATWSGEQRWATFEERRPLARRLYRAQGIRDSVLQPQEARQAAATEAQTLEPRVSSLATKVEALARGESAATWAAGFGLGGVVDGVGHMLHGDGVVKSTEDGAASAAFGTAGTIGAVALCESNPITAWAGELCGAAGGAGGSWFGDKVVGPLINDL